MKKTTKEYIIWFLFGIGLNFVLLSTISFYLPAEIIMIIIMFGAGITFLVTGVILLIQILIVIYTIIIYVKEKNRR